MINRESLAEQVYMVLRDKITRGEIVSGQKLLEDDICGELGVSKTPVRQALSWLEKDGLVNGAKGYTKEVATLTVKEAIEIYTVRSVLEGLAARLMTQSPKREEVLVSLERIYIEASEAIEKKDIKFVLQKDRELHDLILHASGNKLVQELMQNLRYKVMLIQVDNLYPGDSLRSSIKEHRELLDALNKADGDAAELAMKKHICRIIKDKFGSQISGVDVLLPC
ncbi:MAG: hypothetical protein CVU89_08510 [Firmicutes bacterium HGW-Firmicutes-14]|jgi:DNA-binding GntR family transcriptional regulator|nr:MAG: hypothetical protein CVU89_08510 [Firmicutes bacterium HGW-Firmicutes-14]